MSKKILLINDMPSLGKVALNAMIPILSYRGHEVFALPSCLISNTLDYGKYNIEDTTDYMINCLKTYQALNFNFDCLCTGFIINERQVEIIKNIKKENPNLLLIVDPIMADDGKLYNSMSQKNILYFKVLCKIADVVIPNYTESLLLTDQTIKSIKCNANEIKNIINNLHTMGASSVVITSCLLEDGIHGVYGYDKQKDHYFLVYYERMNIRFAGSGDIFSALLTDNLLKGLDLEAATFNAVKGISELLRLNMEQDASLPNGHFKGIQIEPYLSKILF